MGITARQFEALQQRTTRRSRRPEPTLVTSLDPAPACTPGTIILGLDPSLRGSGYGIIRLARPHPSTLAHGTIRCPASWPRSRCLARISSTLRDLIQQFHPTICAVEGLFYAQNLQTALIMGEARGAALASVAEAGLDIFEIAPRKMKQAVVGYGAAQKLAVARMVQRMLNLPEPPEADAADALALALAHAQESSRYHLAPARRL